MIVLNLHELFKTVYHDKSERFIGKRLAGMKKYNLHTKMSHLYELKYITNNSIINNKSIICHKTYIIEYDFVFNDIKNAIDNLWKELFHSRKRK